MSNSHISNAAAIEANDAIVDLLDADSSVGYIRIYDDGASQPSSVDDSVPSGSTLLSEHDLEDPAFGDSADADPGAEAEANVADATAEADGTAAWFRAFDGAGTAIFDGDVSAEGDGGDLQLNSTSITADTTVSITSCTFGHSE